MGLMEEVFIDSVSCLSFIYVFIYLVSYFIGLYVQLLVYVISIVVIIEHPPSAHPPKCEWQGIDGRGHAGFFLVLF